MPIGKLVFAQLMDFLPLPYVPALRFALPFELSDQNLFTSRSISEHGVLRRLTFRESLRDIEVCLRAHEAKLYHLGIRGHVARSNLGDANEKCDWRILSRFREQLDRAKAKRLYADDAFAVDLDKQRVRFRHDND